MNQFDQENDSPAGPVGSRVDRGEKIKRLQGKEKQRGLLERVKGVFEDSPEVLIAMIVLVLLACSPVFSYLFLS